MCSGLRDAGALAWRLNAILDGKAGDTLLDSYGPERLHHVRELIDFSIALGKVICITDPEAAAARDRGCWPRKPRPVSGREAPQPRLGAGLYDPHAPGSGWLAPQGMVESGGRRGLFDDVPATASP